MFAFKPRVLWQESKIFPSISCGQHGTASDTISGGYTTPLRNKERTPYNRTVSQGSEWPRTLSKFQTTLWERWDSSPDVWFQRLCSFHPHTCHFKTAPRTCYSWQRTKVAAGLQGTPPPTGSFCFHLFTQGVSGKITADAKKKSVPTLEKEMFHNFYIKLVWYCYHLNR